MEPDMPDTEVVTMVNVDVHSGVEYENLKICSELLNSSAALASRAASKAQVSDLRTFLN